MPNANVDGIDTYYETHGTGSPILMCAPGGFDATIDKWRSGERMDGHRCDRGARRRAHGDSL